MKTIELICSFCSKTFVRNAKYIKWHPQEKYYCSHQCYNSSITAEKIELECPWCGKTFYRNSSYLRKNIPIFGKLFCSNSCSTSIVNTRRVGKYNPNWKEDSGTYRKKYLSSACEICGESRDYLLVVHHIDKDRANNKEENLKTLCYNCHALEHLVIIDGKLAVRWDSLTSPEVLKFLTLNQEPEQPDIAA